MEGFEHLVKVALEAETFVVSGNLKFAVKLPVKKKSRSEEQTHGYEIDLVGARKDLLVLASVKSFFGSTGVRRGGFCGLVNIPSPTAKQQRHFNLYKLFNYENVRAGVVAGAAKRFGYSPQDIELRLYVGKFQNAAERSEITAYLQSIHAGRGPIQVFDLQAILAKLLEVLKNKTYFNDPVIMTLKAIAQAIRQAQGTSLKEATRILHETLGLTSQGGK